MTEKHRQAQLFTGPVQFDGPVTFNGTCTVRFVQTSLGAVAAGLVVAAFGGVVTADNSILDHADRLIGVSLGAGLVATAGELTGPWSFTLGDVLYLGLGGALTTTPPTTGFQQKVGIASGSSTLVVSLDTAIILA